MNGGKNKWLNFALSASWCASGEAAPTRLFMLGGMGRGRGKGRGRFQN